MPQDSVGQYFGEYRDLYLARADRLFPRTRDPAARISASPFTPRDRADADRLHGQAIERELVLPDAGALRRQSHARRACSGFQCATMRNKIPAVRHRRA